MVDTQTAPNPLQTEVCGLTLSNPVCTASGTFAFGDVFESFMDVSQLGAITLKGVAASPWPGNPAPRMCETASGMMNSVGLANPGVEALNLNYGSYLKNLQERDCRVIVQAAGHSVDEFIAAVDKISESMPYSDAIELNISCPNLARGGKLVGGTPHDAEEVVSAVRSHTDKPLFVKMAPIDVAEIARACESAGADALSLINTINAMSINVHTRKSRLSRPTGGLSGPAIHPIAVRMVWEAANAVSIPINAMGGISSWEDAAEMILVGASMVSVGTANFAEPTSAVQIIEGLSEWVKEQGVSHISELRGAFIC